MAINSLNSSYKQFSHNYLHTAFYKYLQYHMYLQIVFLLVQIQLTFTKHIIAFYCRPYNLRQNTWLMIQRLEAPLTNVRLHLPWEFAIVFYS